MTDESDQVLESVVKRGAVCACDSEGESMCVVDSDRFSDRLSLGVKQVPVTG